MFVYSPHHYPKEEGERRKKRGGVGVGGWETDSADNQVTTCDYNSNKYNNNQNRYFMDSQSALIGFLLER